MRSFTENARFQAGRGLASDLLGLESVRAPRVRSDRSPLRLAAHPGSGRNEGLGRVLDQRYYSGSLLRTSSWSSLVC
jgi:hypothetical protein